MRNNWASNIHCDADASVFFPEFHQLRTAEVIRARLFFFFFFRHLAVSFFSFRMSRINPLDCPFDASLGNLAALSFRWPLESKIRDQDISMSSYSLETMAIEKKKTKKIRE